MGRHCFPQAQPGPIQVAQKTSLDLSEALRVEKWGEVDWVRKEALGRKRKRSGGSRVG